MTNDERIGYHGLLSFDIRHLVIQRAASSRTSAQKNGSSQGTGAGSPVWREEPLFGLMRLCDRSLNAAVGKVNVATRTRRH